MSTTSEPFVDMVQRALMRPERHLDTMTRWKTVKADAERVIGQQRKALDAARVFRLSEDFTRLAARVSMEPPETFLNALSCARAPYDRTWIEWDEQCRLQELSGEAGPDSAAQIGMLIEREPGTDTTFRVSTFFRMRDRDQVMQSSVGYRFDTEGPVAYRSTPVEHNTILWDNLDFTVKGEDGIMLRAGWPENVLPLAREHLAQVVLTGRGWIARHARGGNLSTARGRHALEQIMPRLVTSTGPGWHANFGAILPRKLAEITKSSPNRTVRNTMIHTLEALEGDWRFLVSVLALLQSKWIDKVQTRMGGATRTVHTRTGKWLDVHECTITAPKERIIRAYARHVSSGASKRRHEVIGHFCERVGSGKRDCVHHYETNEKHQQVCTLCGHTRWWRSPHFRGDEKIGMVAKTYHVISPSEERKQQ